MRSRALALQSRDAASIGAARTAETARVIFQASLVSASKSGAWIRNQAGELARKLRQGRLVASPWLQATADAAGARLSTLTAEVRQIAERQGENAAFLAMRLNAQVKGEIDALKRAAHDGRLTLPGWDKVPRLAFARHASANGGEAPMALPKGDELEREKRATRNALIPIEPWRCRLPVIKSDRLADQLFIGAISRAPTEARRSS
jgi:hypothetical protein